MWLTCWQLHAINQLTKMLLCWNWLGRQYNSVICCIMYRSLFDLNGTCNLTKWNYLTKRKNWNDEWHPGSSIERLWNNMQAILSAIFTSGSKSWSRGGPQTFFRDFANIAKWSWASEASQYWPGSRACLRALEALAFLTLKYAFSHFSWYFFFKIFYVHLWVNYKICISIWKILNI